ncbi:hypothetical protein NM208_g2816 [Fusarium decemcellulare]|uniref:Uncharacterized protein n=1 Tax=Fusarium decemcellulare TaxID=57161 RepID=A0ACC1SRE6_9HYPO|nr:hypothetical protein NM208_g2816 [Fusarium decemcellulare]
MSKTRNSTPGTVTPQGSMEEVQDGAQLFEAKPEIAGNQDYLLTGNTDGLQRSLTNRMVQLSAIGASIGTALFLSIGGVLVKAGPASLFLAFVVYNIFLAMLNNCIAEMVTYMPVSGGFIRLAGKWVDDALGFMVGWNFFLYQVVLIPFEITALSMVLSYWSDNIPVGAICGGCILLYGLLNAFTVKVYGESEFWLSGGKVILLFILLSFTFITMVGGNPQHDAFGFRYWKNPGAFAEFSSTGMRGQFEGFLAALWAASFTCVGPEFVSIVAAEAKHPRIYIKTAYKIVFVRILVFYIGSAIAVGILVPHNEPTMTAIFNGETGNSGSAAASPYIIAMGNLGIGVLPHIITALITTTIFAAGNSVTYYGIRSLYGLSIEGRAPKFLRKTTKQGVPIYCVLVVMVFPFLSFLQMSSGSTQVLDWLIDLATGCTIVSYIVIAITYICFHRATVAQNFDRKSLAYRGCFQPCCAWLALVWEILIITFYGYKSFSPFSIGSFFTHYAMVILMPILFCGWKYTKGTKWLKPEEVDLVWDAPYITAYEEAATDRPIGFFRDVWQSLPFNKPKNKNEDGKDC